VGMSPRPTQHPLYPLPQVMNIRGHPPSRPGSLPSPYSVKTSNPASHPRHTVVPTQHFTFFVYWFAKRNEVDTYSCCTRACVRACTWMGVGAILCVGTWVHACACTHASRAERLGSLNNMMFHVTLLPPILLKVGPKHPYYLDQSANPS